MSKWHIIPSFARRFWRRLCRASKTEFLLDFFNSLALVYQFTVSVWFASARLENATIHPVHGWIFLGAFSYSFIHRVFLKERFQKRKWNVESIRRSQAIGIALSRLANGVRANRFTAIDLHQIEQGLLSAIKSEVESILGDSEGIYLAANLIVEEPGNNAMLLVLNRTSLDREPYSRYSKTGSMVAWRAMDTRAWAYEQDFDSGGEKPYRAILAFPIVSHIDSIAKSVGAISIDSSVPGHFDGHETKLETVLLPYLSIQKLVLTYRNKYNIWRS